MRLDILNDKEGVWRCRTTFNCSEACPRGIEVTIQKDDGQVVTIAQRDDGDVQMGDRVMIVYDGNGVASAVRDTGRRRD